MRVVRFYKSCPVLPPLPLPLRVVLLFAVIFAIIFASCMLQAADRSGQRRISNGSSREEWAALDLNRGAPERSGQRRTSTGELSSGVGSAGPQPGSSRAEWAAPDLSCQKKNARKYVRQVRQECQKWMSEDM